MRDFERDPIREFIAIAAPLERCWALSTNVELVKKTLGMTPVDGVTSGHIREGSRVHWRGWKFGLPTHHHTLITEFHPPHAGRMDDGVTEFVGQRVAWFEDSQERGRFAAFHHMHMFREQGGRTLLEDLIHFSLGFGVAGRIVAQSLLAPHIRRLAKQRFEMIKQLAEGDGWRAWVMERPDAARHGARISLGLR